MHLSHYTFMQVPLLPFVIKDHSKMMANFLRGKGYTDAKAIKLYPFWRKVIANHYNKIIIK